MFVPKTKPDRKHALSKSSLHTIKNLNDVLVYIWLKNGNGFWYYISYSTKNSLIGYIWNGKNWTKKDLNLKFLMSYY